jgi:HEAT repeat protein
MHMSWFIRLDQVHSSYLVLMSLATAAVAGGVLLRLGLLGRALRGLGFVVGTSIRQGFLLWERLLSWASWLRFLVIVLAFLVAGVWAGGLVPGLRVVCGLVPLLMGITACLAYMFIDLERYEVERGHKAVHNPLKGQEPAVYLARYGQQVRVPLLLAAAVGVVGGFALLNQGLYETVGRDWFQVEGGQGGPGYVDFLAYALINLLHILDVLNLFHSNHFLQTTYVHQIRWPASLLLSGFKAFFTLVLLQQIFSSLRQGKLLAETITDLWSPHEPIHERARHALPQYGTLAIEPLLVSLRSVSSLTKEQRDQLPLILATIGPATIPTLVRYLHDDHAQVRAIAAAALGRLHALDTVPLLVALGHDPSDVVRQSLVEALGILGGQKREGRRRQAQSRRENPRRGLRAALRRLPSVFRGLALGWKKRGLSVPLSDPVELAVTTLASALADDSAAVRTQAALALGRIGSPAAAVAPRLIALLQDEDETVRCQAAEALGQVSGEAGEPVPAVAALVELLHDASAPVKAAAARALGALKRAAAPAVTALAPLLQDRDEGVRTAAAEAIAQVGPLNGTAVETLVEGLASPDTVVRAQTAEALGTIGATAEDTAGALVEAMADGNDRVRAKAAQALGKIGGAAAETSVPSLMRALRDQDNWVSALAAEALGQMGESADEAVPALVHSLGHLNPLVRGNAAEALGKMGGAAASARQALEKAARDEDGGVRSQAVRALGTLGRPSLTSAGVVLDGLHDPDPLVRTAAVESVGQWGEPSAAVLGGLAPLLEDANDQVKVAATRVLPKLAGPTPAVIDGLCRRLLEDDSAWVQVHAALALGKLGPAAAAAGEPLLRASQTGEVSVREQALRALALIQPPEMVPAFTSGLTDADAEVRKVASGGWMKAPSVPEEVIPVLVAALRDPEVRVRTNAARALARLDPLPPEAIPLLVDCSVHADEALRLTAAMALKVAPAGVTGEAMPHLLEDANVRIRLIAAGSLLSAEPGNARAGAALAEALGDPAPRVRKAALELVESLGSGAAAFLEVLKKRSGLEEDADLRAILDRLGKRLENQDGAGPAPVADSGA